MICFTRVDNRLIHGQVVQGWLSKIKAEKILVISKQAASNILMSKMMRLAVPQGYELQITEASKVKEILALDKTKKIFLLVEDLAQLLEVIEQGINLEKVNIGNTKYEEGKKAFAEGVYFDKEDLALIHKMQSKNVTFGIRALPSSLEEKINV